MPPSTQEQLQRAQHLLNAPQSRHEDNIRQDIGRLLDSLQVDNRITHKTPGGDADLYLPRRRIVIETKSDGLATDPHRPQPGYNNETPFQQLERYLLSELEDEKSRLSLDDHPDLRWTGILTDGRIWHVWHYDHVYGAVAQHLLNAFRPRDAAELLRELLPIFNVDPIGKPWIPSNPLPIFQPSHDRLRDIYDNLGGRNLAETETKKQLWREMLRTSSMEPENDAGRHRLFVTHSFLVALARGVIHTLSSPTVAPAPEDILEPSAFNMISNGSESAEHPLRSLSHDQRHPRRNGALDTSPAPCPKRQGAIGAAVLCLRDRTARSLRVEHYSAAVNS